MKLVIVAAVALDGTIGDSKTNSLPWNIPGDLRNFKAITSGKTIVMGRRTYESIGRPLPNRRNVVITSDPYFYWRHHVPTYTSVESALANEKDELFVIGGQRIFESAINLVPRELYITVVKKNFNGDVKFPVEGHEFLYNLWMHPKTLSLYQRQSAPLWIEENGVEYSFTKFVAI